MLMIRLARFGGKKTEPVRCKPRGGDVFDPRAVIPKHPYGQTIVLRSHWSGGADNPFLRR